jgi:hypothetical protein
MCEWCGQLFTPAERRGPVPRYCRASHRQRAYEKRRGLRAATTIYRPVTVTSPRSDRPDADTADRRRAPSSPEARRRLDAARRAAHASSSTQATTLRPVVEQLAEALTDVFSSLGLPVIDGDTEALWALVQPVSQVLRQARETLEKRARSPRQLEAVRQQLLSAATAVADPAEHADRQSRYGRPRLPIVVPGPDGAIPTGVIDCELVGGTRRVRWYPKGWTHDADLLPQVAGRSPDFRYRWQDRRVWEQLALDLIILCCGWRTAPAALPPALKEARILLGNQLRRDISVGTWTLQPAAVLTWLEHANVVIVYREADREPSVR